MASIITIAGEKLFAAKAQANEQLDIDTFIFANVPGQDATAPISREEGLPSDYIVHQQIVQQVGRINDNVVVYSTVLDSVTGPFEFNWVGLYSSVNNTLVAINHIPTTPKTVTADGVAGNTLNRNFGIEYSGIADLTGIDVAPETWQLDFTARLQGMDKLTQQLAADMNGKDWFIGEGFKVEPRETANSFRILPGVGYVSGLRVELENEHIFTVESYPQFVYVDAWFEGNANSEWSPSLSFTLSDTEIDDYTDASGIKHYVNKLSEIIASDTVTDLRKESESAEKSWVHDTTFIRRSSFILAASDAGKGRFKDGCVIETLGYYNAYDGGGCRYEVTNNQLVRIPEGPVTYKQFGAKGGAEQDAIQAMIAAHDYANSFNLPVEGDGDSYLISGQGCIKVQTDTNLAGSKLVLSRTGTDKWIEIIPSQNKAEKQIPDTVLSKMKPYLISGKTYIPKLGNEHEILQSYVYIKTDKILTERVGFNYFIYAQDSFTLLRDGNLIGQLITDLNVGNITEATYKPLENSTLTFKDFNLLLNFNDEEIPQFVIERNQVDIKEFSVRRVARDLLIQDGVGQVFKVNRCYKISFDTADGDAIGYGYYGNGAYGYMINCSNVVDLTIDRVQGNGGWGITGSNWLKDALVTNSQINRWDVHFGMGNLTIRDSELYGYGVNVTYGDGHVSLENIKLYPQNTKGIDGIETSFMSGWMIGSGNSYGHWWRGSITIKDPEVWLDPEGDKNIFKFIYVPNFNNAYSSETVLKLGTQWSLVRPKIRYINKRPDEEKEFHIFGALIEGTFNRKWRMPSKIHISSLSADTEHSKTYLHGFAFENAPNWSDESLIYPSSCELIIEDIKNKMSIWDRLNCNLFGSHEDEVNNIKKYSLADLSLDKTYGNTLDENSLCSFDITISNCKGSFYDAYYNQNIKVDNSIMLVPRCGNQKGGVRRISGSEVWGIPNRDQNDFLILLQGEWIANNNVMMRSKRQGLTEPTSISKTGLNNSTGNLLEKGGNFDADSINILWQNQSANLLYETPDSIGNTI